MGRADRQAGLRIEERLRSRVSAGEKARLRRPDVQEHQGREQCAAGRGSAAGDQSRRLVHWLLRPIAGAAEGAYEEPGEIRPGDVARAEGRSGGWRRLLRAALALLGDRKSTR